MSVKHFVAYTKALFFNDIVAAITASVFTPDSSVSRSFG